MITSCILLLASVGQPLPNSLLNDLGFKPIREIRPARTSTKKAKSMYARYTNSGGEDLRISVSWVDSEGAASLYPSGYGSYDHLMRLRDTSALRPFATTAPSGCPPGMSHVYYEEGGATVVLPMDAPSAQVKVDYTTHVGSTSKGFADPAPFDYSTKAALVERIARHTLANAAGLRLDDAGVGALAGRRVKKAKCRRSNRVFGRVDEWTEGAGWTIAEEDKYGLIHLKKGAKWAVLPLGADQIKVNGVWKEMGDSAAFLNGKLYLPEAGLKHIRDAD